MTYTVTLTIDVEADCSRAALARVLACIRSDLGKMKADIDPDDDGDLDGVFESASQSEES